MQRYVAAMLLGLFLVLPGVLSAQPVGQPYTHQQTGLQFPGKLAGFVLTKTDTYEQKELGTSLRYEDTERTKVNVFVYDLGIPDLPDDINAQVVRQHVQQMAGDIYALEKRGDYVGVREVLDGTVQIGKLKGWFKVFEYSQKGDPGASEGPTRKSYAVLTVSHKNFIKVRLTCWASDGMRADRKLREFLAELGGVFK